VPSTSKTQYTVEQAETDITDLRGMTYLIDEIITQYDSHVPNLPSASGYTAFSLGGQEAYLGFDGNAYNTGRLTILYTGTGQTVNSTTPVVITGLSVPLAVGTYKVSGRVRGLQGSTTAVQAIRLIAPDTLVASTLDVDYTSGNWGSFTTILSNYNNVGALNADMSTASMTNGFTFTIRFEGIIVVSTAGTLNVDARCVTSGSDTWTVEAVSWLQIEPITVT
jgi:hypothetical protein